MFPLHLYPGVFLRCLDLLSIPLSALAPGMGVAVYAGLVGALLLCVILVLCVAVLAYRRRCRHLHGDITDSSSALTAAFHPGNYKPPRQGEFTHANSHVHTVTLDFSVLHLFFIFTTSLVFAPRHRSCTIHFIFTALFISHTLIFFFFFTIISSRFHNSPFFIAFHFLEFKHLSWYLFPCSCHQILISDINPFHSHHF